MLSSASEAAFDCEAKIALTTTMAMEKEIPSSAGEAELGGTPPGMIDANAERRLLRKIDLHVYPILFLIYIMSFLDRINISNARIQGMAKDLDLYGDRFNVALFVCENCVQFFTLEANTHPIGLLRPLHLA